MNFYTVLMWFKEQPVLYFPQKLVFDIFNSKAIYRATGNECQVKLDPPPGAIEAAHKEGA